MFRSRACKHGFLLPLLLLTVPCLFASAYEESGLASWYGGKFQGRRTANGEIFDTNELTAAHKTLPFGTLVRVTNKENQLSVIVRINDRGPFIDGRIIDLSRAAAEQIGMVAEGVAPVHITTISHLDSEADIDELKKEYIVQVAAYSSPENVLRTIRLLQKIGYDPLIEITRENIHRVIIGSVGARKVEDVIEELAELGFPDAYIRSRD